VSVLACIGATLLTIFFACYRFVNWGNLFRISSAQARSEAGPAMLAFAICFTMNIPMDVVQRVQLGLQEGFRTNVWQLCASVMSLAGIVGGVHLHLGVPVLVLAFAGAPVLGAMLNGLYFFGITRRDLLPSWHFISREVISQISQLGIMFFIIQVVVSISFSADNLIIARTLGVGSVTLYAIPQRMFSLIAVLAGMLVAPLWPAYGEAVSRGDMSWVKRTLSRTLLGIFGLSSLIATVLILLSKRILLLWVGPSIHPSMMLILGLGIWAIIQCVTGTLQAFMNGASILRFQVITHCIFGVACLTTKLFFARHYGLSSVPWATILTYSLLIVLPYAAYVPSLITRMTANAQAQVIGSLGAEGF
jgi:O-antigen/teichoic acid export membrane protein